MIIRTLIPNKLQPKIIFGNLSVFTLFLRGIRNDFVSDVLFSDEEALDEIRNYQKSKVVSYEDLGHFFVTEDADRVIADINIWLDES
jgi:hypothetical protein